jgi:hypothetical protein
MSWDEIDNQGGGNSSSGNKAEFAKFPTGVTRVRVLEQVPHVRWTHWMNASQLVGITGKGRSINCPGKDCPICNIRRNQKANGEQYTYNMAKRFALQVYNYETKRVEIMEQGRTFMEDLRDLKEDFGGNITKFDIKVRRRGTGQEDTSYRLDKLADEESAELPKLPDDNELLDLNEYFQPHTHDQIVRLLNKEPWDEVMSSSTSDKADEGQNEEVELK